MKLRVGAGRGFVRSWRAVREPRRRDGAKYDAKEKRRSHRCTMHTDKSGSVGRPGASVEVVVGAGVVVRREQDGDEKASPWEVPIGSGGGPRKT